MNDTIEMYVIRRTWLIRLWEEESREWNEESHPVIALARIERGNTHRSVLVKHPKHLRPKYFGLMWWRWSWIIQPFAKCQLNSIISCVCTVHCGNSSSSHIHCIHELVILLSTHRHEMCARRSVLTQQSRANIHNFEFRHKVRSKTQTPFGKVRLTIQFPEHAWILSALAVETVFGSTICSFHAIKWLSVACMAWNNLQDQMNTYLYIYIYILRCDEYTCDSGNNRKSSNKHLHSAYIRYDVCRSSVGCEFAETMFISKI